MGIRQPFVVEDRIEIEDSDGHSLIMHADNNVNRRDTGQTSHSNETFVTQEISIALGIALG